MSRNQLASAATTVCSGGAGLQLWLRTGRDRLSLSDHHQFWVRAAWLFANVGMIGGAVGWLLLDVAAPRTLALVGGSLAVAGYLMRMSIR